MHQADTTRYTEGSMFGGGGACSRGMRRQGRLGNILRATVNTLKMREAQRKWQRLKGAEKPPTDQVRSKQKDVLFLLLFLES